jgi:hypothetical protein
MKTLLAAAVLAITGAVTVQAADIFTCGGLGYAMHDGKVERVCTAPVTTHWTKLGQHSSALVYYTNEPDDLQECRTRERSGMGRTHRRAAEPVSASKQRGAPRCRPQRVQYQPAE